MADLIRHEQSDFTNLTDTDSWNISVFVENNIDQIHNKYVQYTSYLDFYCQQCRVPVRIYYFGDELLASTKQVYGYDLGFIVEGDV
jgi:hypothetical protein